MAQGILVLQAATVFGTTAPLVIMGIMGEIFTARMTALLGVDVVPRPLVLQDIMDLIIMPQIAALKGVDVDLLGGTVLQNMEPVVARIAALKGVDNVLHGIIDSLDIKAPTDMAATVLIELMEQDRIVLRDHGVIVDTAAIYARNAVAVLGLDASLTKDLTGAVEDLRMRRNLEMKPATAGL
ncbi:uncharacterized protein LOC115442466 [Manduca sexta]|uniref:uncharacterized protein LOC115442466 n=1 Tax=Manduca sexta TaxID=7130 RepID=UPI00188DE22E|nr:uncharacterized protein LOC115442466 [Manduca sexta]XP_037303650.1 uncharacterized protein LOC115442466 [Manduca sexta]